MKFSISIRVGSWFSILCLSGLFGQTAEAGVGLSSSFQDWNREFRLNEHFPTVDYRSSGFHWQLNLLDTIQALTEEDLLVLAGAGHYQLYEEDISDSFRGVGTVGAGVGFFQDAQKDELEIWMTFSPKMGVELGDSVGMGLYLRPNIGATRIMTDTIQHELLVGGGIQLSVWSMKWP